jgi:hypothetical protein
VETKFVLTSFISLWGTGTKHDKSKLKYPVFRPRFELDTYQILFRSYTNLHQFVGNNFTFWEIKQLVISWTNPHSNIFRQWHWRQTADGKILQRIVIVNIYFKMTSHWKKSIYTISTNYTACRICSRNLRTFISILAAEKSGCVKYEDFFLWRSWSGFYSSIIENAVRFVNILF